MVIFPHDTVPHAAVIPIGDPPPAACEEVAETIRETFEISVPIRDPIEEPPEIDSATRTAGQFLERVTDETDGVDIAVGVTDSELRLHADETALFGVGLEYGTVGIVSTTRPLDGTDPTALERERLAKETLSVVGTLLGLRTRVTHDGDERACVGTASEKREELDAKPATYCGDCRDALTGDSTARRPPSPDDWVVKKRVESDGAPADGRDRRTWIDYLLAPIGLVVIGAVEFVALVGPLVDRLPHPGTGSARDLPESVHTIYRTAAFWANVVLYLGAVFCWSLVTVSVHDRVVGPTVSDGAAIEILLASVVFGVLTAWFVKALVGGLRFVAAEEW